MPGLRVEKPVYRDWWATVLFVPLAIFTFTGFYLILWARGDLLLSFLGIGLLQPFIRQPWMVAAELGGVALMLALLFYIPKVYLYYQFGVQVFFVSGIVAFQAIGLCTDFGLGLTLRNSIAASIAIVMAIVVCLLIRRRVPQSAAILQASSQLFKQNGFFTVYILGYLPFWLVFRFFVAFPVLFLNIPIIGWLPFCLSLVGFAWAGFVVTCLCQAIVSTATMVALEGESTERSVFDEIVRRSLTTSFGSICLGALVMPFKMLIGVDDSHAYAKMVRDNTSYWEACRDPPKSELARKNLFRTLVWLLMYYPVPVIAVTTIIHTATGPISPFAFIETVSLDRAVIMMCLGAFAARMQVCSTPTPVLLKYEEDPDGFAAKYPAIKGEQATEDAPSPHV